jgi:hypothetical protein
VDFSSSDCTAWIFYHDASTSGMELASTSNDPFIGRQWRCCSAWLLVVGSILLLTSSLLAYGHKNAGKNQVMSPVISHHWPCLHCSCSPFEPFFAFLINLYKPIPSLPWMHCDKKSRRYNPMTKNPESRLFKRPPTQACWPPSGQF